MSGNENKELSDDKTANKKPPTKKIRKSCKRTLTEKSILGKLPITTSIYTGSAVDALFDGLVIGTKQIAIEDEEIPGEFYSISVRSGRLFIERIEH